MQLQVKEAEVEKLQEELAMWKTQRQKEYTAAIKHQQNHLAAKETETTKLREEIDMIKKWKHNINTVHKREEKLIMSAFYEIGCEIQRRNTYAR